MQDLIILILTLLASLFVALLAVHYDRKMKDKKELGSLIDSIIFELTRNFSIARTIKNRIDNDVTLIKKGGWPPTPDPAFVDLAYSRAILSETFYDFIRKKKLNILMKKLHECYAALQVVNNETRIINEAKFEVLIKPSLLPKRIEEILQKRKETMVKVIEPTIAEVLLLFAQIEPKFQDTIKLLTNTQKTKLQSNTKR